MTLEREIEYEYGITLSAEGNIDFLPLKTGIKPELNCRKLTKTKSQIINTYCYSFGELTPKPKWIFELRSGETHLEAAKEILFVVEIPKDKIFSGHVKLFQRDIILLNPDHKELSMLETIIEKAREIRTKIKSLVTKDFKPVEFDFPLSAETRKLKHRSSPPLMSHETVSAIEELLDQAENEGLL